MGPCAATSALVSASFAVHSGNPTCLALQFGKPTSERDIAVANLKKNERLGALCLTGRFGAPTAPKEATEGNPVWPLSVPKP